MELTDFTLLLSDPVEDRSTLWFALQVPAAGGLAAITEPLHRSCDLTRVAPAMTYPGPGRELLLAAGLELGRALFPEVVATRFRQALAAARPQGAGIRIRILAGTTLQHLPWEYTVLPPEHGEATELDFAALLPHASLVRDQEGAPRLRRADATPAIRVLGCVAAPRTLVEIDVERERRRLETALGGLNIAIRWTERGTRPSVALGRVDLFHFAGHGGFEARCAGGDAVGGATRDIAQPPAGHPRTDSRDGWLMFDDGAGGADRMRAGELALVLRELGVRIAVLNACETAMRDERRWWNSAAAALLNAGIGGVVAMQHKILDTSALTFATAFYSALAEGCSLDDAVRRGRLAVFSRDGFGWGTPVLYLSTDETVAFATPRACVASAAGPEPAPPRGERRFALPGWTGPTRHLAWSIDSARLAASDGKATCATWNRSANWQPDQRLQVAAIDCCCGWIDTRLVIARGDRLHLVDSDVRELARLELPVRHVLPLHSLIACIDAAGGAYLYEPHGGLVDRAPLGPGPWSIAVASPHDELFAVATAGGRLAIWGPDRKLVTATVRDGIIALAFVAADTLVAALASGSVAAFATESRSITRLADLATPGLMRAPLAIVRGRIADRLTTDGVVIHRLAVPGVESATVLAATPVHDGVHCLAWSPDATRLAVGTSTAIVLHEIVAARSPGQAGEPS